MIKNSNYHKLFWHVHEFVRFYKQYLFDIGTFTYVSLFISLLQP